MKILLLIVLGFFSNMPIYGSNFEWWSKLQRIKPLQSNRVTVENLFGKPTGAGVSATYYKIGKNRLSVKYSDGKCNNYEKGEWKAPAETVLRYTLNINSEITLNDFAKFAKINLRSFTIDTYANLNDVDTPTQIPYNYVNENLGIFLLGYKRGYENKNGSLRAGDIVYLSSISIDVPENNQYLKCG